MHEITSATGAKVMVSTTVVAGDATGKAAFTRPAWEEMPGHVSGRYTNHADREVQELALAWRMKPGASVAQAYVAMRMLSGGALCRAADAAAKRRGYKNHVAMRRAAGLTK